MFNLLFCDFDEVGSFGKESSDMPVDVFNRSFFPCTISVSIIDLEHFVDFRKNLFVSLLFHVSELILQFARSEKTIFTNPIFGIINPCDGINTPTILKMRS